MVKEKRIDSFFERKRSDCQTNEPEPATEAALESETGALDEPEPERAAEETHVQPPLLLLEFRQQNHEEQGHQTHRNKVQFRGIQFLERDPALRPQIWQYPCNQS